MIEFIDSVQNWFTEPFYYPTPEPLNFEMTPVSELPKGRLGVAIRNAELFASAYAVKHFHANGKVMPLIQWLETQNMEALIQALIEHSIPEPTAPRITGAEIVRQCDIARSTLVEWEKSKDFPLRIEGIKTKVYDLNAVNIWLASRGKPTVVVR